MTETICPYCGVGCNLELHVQDNEIVKVTSPLDHSVTHRQPVHQGPVRLPVRAERPRRPAPPKELDDLVDVLDGNGAGPEA